MSAPAKLVRDRMSSPVARLRPDDRLDIARALMLERRIRHLPVESDGGVVGVLSLGDLLATWPGLPARSQPVLLRERTAADRMTRPAIQASPTDRLVDAAHRMLTARIGCLPVTDRGVLVGIVTATDLLEEAIARLAKEPRPPTTAQLMSLGPLTVSADETLDLAHSLMKARRLRHLPVLEGDAVVGMLSQHDVLGAVGSDAGVVEKQGVRVRSTMSTPAIFVVASAPATDAAETLRRRRIGALPVIREGRLVGIITAADFCSYLIAST